MIHLWNSLEVIRELIREVIREVTREVILFDFEDKKRKEIVNGKSDLLHLCVKFATFEYILSRRGSQQF